MKVGYGSCSGCDTLEGIRYYNDDKPTEEQVRDYATRYISFKRDEADGRR